MDGEREGGREGEEEWVRKLKAREKRRYVPLLQILSMTPTNQIF